MKIKIDFPKKSNSSGRWPWGEPESYLTHPNETALPVEKNQEYPRLSIIMPSFNQGEFIEESIRSVLLQGYPNLEFMIFDGGSSDSTQKTIEKYSRWINHSESRSDRGQSHAINKGFKKAFEFLVQNDIANMADGKHVIDGDNIFVSISNSQGKGVKNSKLEAHRKYIDIQYLVSGKELIGIKKTPDCKHVLTDYDPKKDIIFYKDVPDKFLKLKPGEFVVFFPDDAHAPLAGKTEVRKAVVKVSVL